jgi:hypothetical protein
MTLKQLLVLAKRMLLRQCVNCAKVSGQDARYGAIRDINPTTGVCDQCSTWGES